MNLMLAKAIIEALIFASSEPINSKTISEIMAIDEHTVKQIIADLIEEYRGQQRGIQITEVDKGYQFCTNLECAPYLEKLQKVPRNVGLSQAAIETLAIIAYKQPLTKAEIESLRGVSIESPLSTLFEKNLIEEAGRKDAPGRPILYRTTKKFLRYFGLNTLDDLPRIPEWTGTSEIILETMEAEKDDGANS